MREWRTPQGAGAPQIRIDPTGVKIHEFRRTTAPRPAASETPPPTGSPQSETLGVASPTLASPTLASPTLASPALALPPAPRPSMARFPLRGAGRLSTPLNALAPHAPPLLGADGRPLTGTIGEWDAARRPSAPTVAADGAAATPRSSPAVAELPTEFAVASDAVFAATPSRASVSLLGAHRPAVALAATPAELVSQRHWRAAWQAQDPAGANNGARVEGDAAIRAFEMTAGIVATGPTPDSQRQRPADEILAVQRPGASRNWGAGEFAWVAPNSRHNPLYFEDVNLERYGHRFHPVQPLFSAAHFFARIPAMPYLLAAHPSRECVYTLGHDRPGSCAPFEIRRPRWSLAGVVAEAAVATNLIFLLP